MVTLFQTTNQKNMYKFERRLKLTRKAFEDLKDAQNVHPDLVADELEIFIMLARTVTFVLQKELNKSEGFESWYSSKRDGMKDYQYLIDIRNKIEKEGESPIKSGEIIIQFHPYTKATEKIGTYTHPDGRKEDALGKITHTGYLDMEKKKEIIASCSEYLNHLNILIVEAIEKFPEIE